MHVQDDPEWTAEKELCMRKGMPYTAPRQKENVDVSPLPCCTLMSWLITLCQHLYRCTLQSFLQE